MHSFYICFSANLDAQHFLLACSGLFSATLQFTGLVKHELILATPLSAMPMIHYSTVSEKGVTKQIKEKYLF